MVLILLYLNRELISGSHQTGIGGCQIDTNSNLLIDKLIRPACKISLLERPFATVPYLGRGNGNPELESQLQQGDQAINRKSVNHLAEKSYINHRYTPMIPELASSITNPQIVLKVLLLKVGLGVGFLLVI